MKRRGRMRLELLAPRSTGIGEEDIDVVRRLADLCHEAFDFLHARAVGGDGDCLRTGAFVGEGVEGCDGFVAGFGFAGGDVDF